MSIPIPLRIVNTEVIVPGLVQCVHIKILATQRSAPTPPPPFGSRTGFALSRL